MKIVLFIVWVICLMMIWNFCGFLISYPDTLLMQVMETILWMIAGIIMFAITIFVHRHSYEWRYDEKPLALPRWVYWTWLLIALIPIVNVIGFGLGTISYIINWLCDEVHFKCKAKWWTKMIEFLNKGV